MKTKFICAIPVICVLLMAVKPSNHEVNVLGTTDEVSTILGIYDGNEGYGYNFIVKNKATASEYTLTFQKVNSPAMQQYNLNLVSFINQKFEITYSMKTVTGIDSDGDESVVDIYTITKLKGL